MNKMLILVLVGVFIISFSSAFEFDNVGSYDENTRTINIDNGFGFGANLAEITLNTPLNYYVGAGYQKVAEFTIDNKGTYDDALRTMKFYDHNNKMLEFERNFDYRIKTFVEVEVEDYGEECNILINTTKVCNIIVTGTHREQQEQWNNLTNDNLIEGTYIIGIFTDVEIADIIEWIPTFYGVEITQWASWTQDLNVNITNYFKFDEQDTTGTGVIIDSVGNNNAVNNGTSNTSGIISTAYDYDGSNDYIELSLDSVPIGGQSRSFNVWVNSDDITSNRDIITYGTEASTQLFHFRQLSNGSIWFQNQGSEIGSNVSLSGDVWEMVTMTYNGTTVRLYLNATLVAELAMTLNTTTTNPLRFGIFVDAIQEPWNGGIDEAGIWNRTLTQSEITQLFNNGFGIDFSRSIEVELNSPTNDSILDNLSVDFNWTITRISLNITNWTLSVFFSNGTLAVEEINTTINTNENTTVISNQIFLDNNNYIWNVESCGINLSIVFCDLSENRTFTLDTIAPQINITSPVGTLDINSIGSNETLNVTFNDASLDTCWFDYNGTNVTIDGCLTNIQNSTQFILEENNFNMTVYANDTNGIENNTFISWEYKIILNTTFESSVFETQSQSFSINVSANSSLSSSVNMFYDGVLRSTTLSNNVSTVTFDIPPSVGNKDIIWSFTYAGDIINSTTSTQTVNGIQFNLCNGTLTTSYANLSFVNETVNQEAITATISAVWNFWLGSGDETKQVSVSNSTENLFYNFCFSASNETVNTNLSVAYNNNISQQRIFNSLPILTNVTTQIQLFLLPSSLGSFTQFQTRDIASNALSLVKAVITRTLVSSTITVSSSFTDSSGLVIIFLNPDITYSAVFSKTGFVNNAFSFVPTTDLRIVTMGTGGEVNGSNISIGTTYEITPTNSSLVNNTDVTFGFNVSGNDGITFISMNITDQDENVLSFQSNAGLGFISDIINTSNNTRIIGVYEIRTTEENLTITKLWIVGNEFVGDYSIFRQGTLFLDYNFSDFIRLLMVLGIIFGVVIYMSSNELADNNESKVAVIITLIWIFSIIGWLDNPAVVSQTGIAQFGKQYGIAILSSVASVVFFMRRSLF